MTKSASRGASKNASTKNSSESRNGSGLLVTGFLLGIAATLGGQWLMDSGFSENQPTPEVASAADSDENFVFYDLLGNLEVEVPEASSVSAAEDDIVYFLQAGSFRDPEDAESLRVSLILQNMEVEIKAISHEGVLWHRVIAGPYQTRTLMSDARESLIEAGIRPLLLSEDLGRG